MLECRPGGAMSAKVDPELLSQLDRAGDEPVDAIVQLRPQGKPHLLPDAGNVAALSQSVLDRVTSAVGKAPAQTNVLRNLSTLIVRADRDFIRALIGQPE